VTWFDTETGEVPCRHDVLLRQFADGSRSLFTPEGVLQQNGEDDRDDVTVQFVFQDRLYRFIARNFGDYYDTERTVTAIHRALADAGLRERFLALDTGDQTSGFFFGDPVALARAADEMQWPLDQEFNRATLGWTGSG
jgi:hypothetical protein